MKFDTEISESRIRRCRVSVDAEDADTAYDIIYDNYLAGRYDRRMKPDDRHIDDIEIQIYEELH